MTKRHSWVQIYVLLAMFSFGSAFADTNAFMKEYTNAASLKELEKTRQGSERSKEDKRAGKQRISARSEKKKKEGCDKTIEEKAEIEWFEEGYSSAMSGRHSEAIYAYGRALELNPRDVEIYNNRGISYFDLGKYDEAIESQK